MVIPLAGSREGQNFSPIKSCHPERKLSSERSQAESNANGVAKSKDPYLYRTFSVE